ncbi:protein phosphatase CheZ [Cognatilysobacter bugurensis]|uniref:Protein phosphatase CheZ n=1 Tax=Cognatilysobacter bugurensis TaxID=543356 RepID=A0A918T3W2_9GAMM|nr:protein phosphatase CheZ [Lysobacter bugurensis]GHA90304.1 chemotaxis protein [Lysobacter bugurensis]
MSAQLEIDADTALSAEGREDIIRRVRAALCALEHDDQSGFREHLDTLVEWRSQPLVQGLVRLARELGQAFGDNACGTGSLPEACTRLEHAVQVSEEASHRTMDMIDQIRDLLAKIPAPGGTDAAEAVTGIRMRLSEMTAAQGYQDLTGQIIKRVVDIVRCVHTASGGAMPEAAPLQLPAAASNSSKGFGPSVAGVDAAPAGQDDADDLLSSLGL